MRILANDGLDKNALRFFQENNIQLDTKKHDKEALIKNIKNYDILIVRSATRVDREVIDAAKGGRLKMIIRAGVGLDNIDLEYAKKNRILVTNTPNASSNSVAELVLGHMFSLSRFINESNLTMRQGIWNKNVYTGVELYGKTLGIIGFGRIGRNLAQKAEALGMDVVFYDKFVKMDNKYKYCEFQDLLRKADFISVHTPATDKPLIGREEFEIMKDGVFIINAARGGIIDEEALLEALQKNRVAGAGLDVYANEPNPNPELLNHPRVSCTPHIGAATEEAQRRIGEEIIQIVMNFIKEYKTIAI
mgnify:FL=1